MITPHSFSNLGGHSKEPDDRDIGLGAAAPKTYTFPKTLTNTKALAMPIEYQRKQPACGAHSGAEIKGLAVGMRASPRFTWADLKTFDGFPLEAGTDMRSIFKSITKTGVIDFSLLGNDTSLSLSAYAHPSITVVMRSSAMNHAGMGYGFIQDRSFNGLKQFISDHGPAIVLLRVGKEWWTAASGVSSWQEIDILPLRPPASIVSGHFVLAHSYDEKYIYFLNHWSENWGRKGHGYFGEDYMPFINDAGALFPLVFKKDLYYGMSDPDVIDLQRYLNTHGYPVSTQGAGSPGNETNYFGTATKAALMRLQSKNNIMPVSGYFGPLTRAFVTLHQ